MATSTPQYLGYKTAATWAMFSNLHVEGGRTNHWLIPSSWQLVRCCRELITIVGSDCEAVSSYHTYSSFGAMEESHEDEGGGKGGGKSHATGGKSSDRGGAAESPLQAFARRTGCSTVVHANSVLGRGGTATTILPYRVPFWQLARIVSVEAMPTQRDFFVDYVVPDGDKATGEETRHRRFQVKGGKVMPGSDPRLATPPHPLLQKLIYFRSVLPHDRDRGVCHGP